jgi:hypothetical protein
MRRVVLAGDVRWFHHIARFGAFMDDRTGGPCSGVSATPHND